MKLPFNSESQGTISKNSFSCLLNSVTCDRGVGRRIPFIRKKRLRHDFCLVSSLWNNVHWNSSQSSFR
ncbi:hypothetical protein DKP78_01370 [Enterococcus faecium]|nr:hypothetical protein DKP78_01370 [Enterococcus faecium]